MSKNWTASILSECEEVTERSQKGWLKEPGCCGWESGFGSVEGGELRDMTRPLERQHLKSHGFPG